jgi:hypothetical protein
MPIDASDGSGDVLVIVVFDGWPSILAAARSGAPASGGG